MKLWFYGVSWLLASFLRAAIIVFPSFSPSSLLSNTNPFSQKSLVSFFKSDLITTSIVWAPLVMGFQCLLQLMLIQYLLHPIALDISSYSPAIDINTTTLSNYQNSWEAKVPWSPTFPDINELEWKKSLEIHGLSILNGEGKSIVNVGVNYLCFALLLLLISIAVYIIIVWAMVVWCAMTSFFSMNQ